MKKSILIIVCLLFLRPVVSQDYPVSAIPDSLLKNAEVVIREYDLSVIIKDNETFLEKRKKVVTLLKEGTSGYDKCYFPFDKFQEVSEFMAIIYDKDGKAVKKFSFADFTDFKPYSEYVFDVQYKTFVFPHLTYPYTIHYEVTIKHKGSLFYPHWIPQMLSGESVMKAGLFIESPANIMVRYKEIGLPESSKKERLKWSVSGICAKEEEAFSPNTVRMGVMIAPAEFKMENFTGNMMTWEGFGNFMYQLNKDRDEISPKTKAKLKELVADCQDTLCKVERVYQYLQNNTRYFLVALGIGGWQTASALDTDKFKYGDCKGLSNYMIAMLKTVGITAYPALIHAGSESPPQYPDFPNSFFNHQIAVVPLAQDTLWLECTSQTEACGFLSDFTDNRYALIVKEMGSKLVKTPKYTAENNTIHRKIHLKLNGESASDLIAENVYKGLLQVRKSEAVLAGKEIQEKAIKNLLGYDNIVFSTLNYIRSPLKIPEIKENVTLNCQRLGSKSGKRWFIPIKFFSQNTQVPAAYPNRTSKVQASSHPFIESDSILIEIPQGMTVESGLESIDASSLWGNFEVSTVQQGNTIVIYRRLEFNDKIEDDDAYPQLINFMKIVVKYYKSNIVLVKNE